MLESFVAGAGALFSVANIITMVIGIIITPIIAGIAPAKDKDRVNAIFECYNKKHTVSSKHSIDED